MVKTLKLSKTVTCKPLDQWQSVATEMLGTWTHIVHGKKYFHRVIEAGSSGEPLILIHGIGGHAETFARNLHNLANNGFHVYSIDALFHGFSYKEGYRHNRRTELQAEGLADLIEALGHPWVHIEGESMGGDIALEFAMRYPQLCGKVILNTGGDEVVNLKRSDFPENPGGGNELKELSAASILTPTFETVRKRMEWLVVSPDRMTDEMVHIRLRLYSFPAIYESIKRVYNIGGEWAPARSVYTEEQLQTLEVPTLVYWTDKNPGISPAYGNYLAGILPGATFFNQLDCAHWPQWEKPEEHDQIIIDFIKGG